MESLALESLVMTEAALVAPAAAADHVDQFAGAKAELEALFSRRASALERRREREEAEMAADPAKARAEACAEFEARLQAAIEKHSSRDDNLSFTHPGSGDAQHGDGVTLPPSAAPDAPAARSEHPLLIEPPQQPAPPPQRVETDIERMNRVNSTPALPPAREPEPWRKFVDADGNIISPWFIPHG